MDLTKELQLRENNPYSIGSVLQLGEFDFFLERKPLKYVSSQKDRYYTLIESDTLWSIAHQAYGDSKLYWVIQDVNQIEFALDLSVGETLIIPDLPTLRALNSED